MNKSQFPSMAVVELIRQQYPAGTRIKLDFMPDDPNPIPPGSTGTVQRVDDAGNLMMAWDESRSLSLIPGVDQFTVIK